MTPPSSTTPGTRGILLLAAITLAVGALAIPPQSMWMDEGGVAWKSLYPTLAEWWAVTCTKGGSDMQMPAYMLGTWLWEKLFGSAPFALRAINLPFLVVMVLALRRAPFWPVACLVSPFVIYYVAELRPYMMQMAAGACAAAALARVIAPGANGIRGLHALYGAIIFLAISSLSAVVWAGGLFLGALVMRPDWLRMKRFWLQSLAWLPAALGIGGFYAYTLLAGYRGAPSAGGGLLSMGFGGYELAGFMGLGPSRDALRHSPMSLVAHLPWFLPAFACLATAWLLGVRRWLQSVSPRAAIAVAVAVATPLVMLAAIAITQDFRVLGRHMSPMIPAVLLPLCSCLAAGRHHRLQLSAGLAALAVMTTSSLVLRFDPRHARDDYQQATRRLVDALDDGRSIIWRADIATPYYYAYRNGGWDGLKRVEDYYNHQQPADYADADLIFVNRPDQRFRGEDYLAIMARNGFTLEDTFTGFEIWRRSGGDR